MGERGAIGAGAMSAWCWAGVSSAFLHQRNLSPKEQLLKNANNWVSRIRIRAKWLLKRSNRPFNTDDYSAFFSWLVISNALLIILATTTFFSLLIFTINTVFAQEFVARQLGEFITKNSKLSVVFENAIVPGWKDGKISFQKVSVSRRPKKSRKFIKGTSTAEQALLDDVVEYDDGNYTQYDLTIEQVNMTLSFNKWVNGHGIIDTLEMHGVRGVIDRTHVVWDPSDSATNYKNVYHPGDFEIDNFKIDDMLVTLYQPDGFRPFNVEIYNMSTPRLRKHWLFYDLLNSDLVNGSYDGSLFTIHKRQRVDEIDTVLAEALGGGGKDTSILNESNFRLQCCRINSLNLDHLNRGLEGPFGWITNGKVDMIGDFVIPINPPDDILSYLRTLKDNKNRYHDKLKSQDPDPRILLNLSIKLNNVRASVPFQTPELSYINYALIRPIVAYINSKNTYIELHNQIVKTLSDFEGSWTVYDSLLMDDISIEVYNNFVNYVADEESRLVRMKKVSFWSAQLLLQLLLLTIGALS
ncbi:mitochondrial distribution and morphology protein family 31/32 [Yamadazyma tenuis ATCC 10573]|uniref:Mitochondrial distribution and morphology protein family 31/32 n=1 Tax=Candida tenuis (strain ATCC 10573 / BCRC 21748 / CBS 615 / JCM 9827 / NBRC 10315 / NRRL Y-1498 / VKM Y-70) TaxID=590646 RepID=G3B7H0_CANTC|nr:mitochondrial distribution and morphology protein family 31/32 [Yamadazyma tenuis ATCC 10573]EGV62275.1 mitochondrial distribution and morphology protein family 31/32 [Yamadazyma tenuis ATCC 10573]